MTALDALAGPLDIVELARPLENGMPCSPNHPGFRMALLRRHGDSVRADGGSGANELIVTGGHVGTHIDALCHHATNGRLFGGLDAAEVSRGGRFNELGIDSVAPFFCRGVLLDVPRTRGLDRLEAGEAVTADDLAAAAGGVGIRPGDVALVRTGWALRYGEAETYVGREHGAPGVAVSGAEWLARTGVRATGADTIAYEQIRPAMGHSSMPVHDLLLRQHGIHIIEVLDLEELSARGAREFLFVALPLKITGGTGSPIRPVAVLDREQRR